MLFALALMLAYLLGAVPFGYLVGRAKGVDLRAVGSGNVGATNVARALGRPLGLLVFWLDFLKGLLPVWLLAPSLVDRSVSPVGPDATALAFGVAAILGHVLPVWLAFRGGKGVATSAGVCAAVAPLALLLSFALWFVLLRATRFVSVASMGAALGFPLFFIALEGPQSAFGERRLVTGVAFGLAAVIILLHRANLRRLARGEEPQVGAARDANGGSP